jgi:hypothetical protein
MSIWWDVTLITRILSTGVFDARRATCTSPKLTFSFTEYSSVGADSDWGGGGGSGMAVSVDQGEYSTVGCLIENRIRAKFELVIALCFNSTTRPVICGV